MNEHQSWMTGEEFERCSAQLGPAELFDGEVRKKPRDTFLHSLTCVKIGNVINRFVKQHHLGRVLINVPGLHVREHPPRTRSADLVFVSYNRLPETARLEGFLRFPPDLVVHMVRLEDTWKDLLELVADFHQFGVQQVWIVCPYTRVVKRFPQHGKPVVYHDGQLIDGGGAIPGFMVEVSSFLE